MSIQKKHDIIEVEGLTLKHATQAAYLFVGPHGEVWIPKSQCDWDDGVLQISERIAIEKGLV